jgi:glycerophosphoryl diester phosphodiesterase
MSIYCIAHRGASLEAPENTLRAFQRALELGVDGIELDVQVTRDGIPVVFHDFTLTRLTGTRGRLADRTWAELRSLRVRGEPIPTLADALSLTRKRCLLQIEIKKGAPVAPILATIRRTASTKHVILVSFEPDILRQAAALAPNLPRMLIADKPSRFTLLRQGYEGHGTKAAKIANLSRSQAARHLTTESTENAEGTKADHSSLGIGHRAFATKLLRAMSSVGAVGLSVAHQAVASPLFVETIHRHGAQLWCWTVNDVRTMKRLSDYAVDAILTDNPAKLIKTLRA